MARVISFFSGNRPFLLRSRLRPTGNPTLVELSFRSRFPLCDAIVRVDRDRRSSQTLSRAVYTSRFFQAE